MPLKIDFHAHILPETLPNMRERSGYSGWIQIEHKEKGRAVMVKDTGEFFRDVDEKLWSIDARLADMESTGVSMQVLSIVPVMFSYWAKPGDTDFLCRYLNDYLASIVSKHPDKFVGLGTIPLQDTGLAVQELKRCKDVLKLSGLIIGSNVNGKGLDEESMHPIYKAAEDLQMPLFVHPWGMENTGRRGKYMWPYIVGMPSETTSAIAEMIFGGIFEKFPKLKVCFAHGAGMYPYLCGRFERCFETYPKAMQATNDGRPGKYFGRIYADTLLHSEDSLFLANKIIGEDQLMLGSDFPFLLREDVPGNMIEKSSLFTEQQKEKYLYKNALRFLNLDNTRPART